MQITKQNIMARMNDMYGGMSKGQKAITAFISDHYERAVFMTAAKLGDTVGVSESTVVRFATRLGYDGYPEFRLDLEEWVRGKFGRLQEVSDKYKESSNAQILTEVLSADIEKIKDTIALLDPNAFAQAVDTILEARTIYLIGLRSCEPLAEFLSFYLNMIHERVVLLKTTSVTELFEQMLRVGDEDAVIGISFPRYSMRTLKAMEFARDRNAKVITITDSIHSPMNLYSSCNLLARSDMISIVDSLVAPLSVINALVVALCRKCPDEIHRNLTALEAAWNNYQVYLNDEINFIDNEPMLYYPLKKPLTEELS
ncbi:MAG: MurR/RpiR family transcriptional regulator [Lachnospiraceae bacterium]|jgi:DNA-binding MurR/RpiR family transcriptional regulator|nr:MurR/RpiR family transcriptional regulator [Lachnospiraceae bacterium]